MLWTWWIGKTCTLFTAVTKQKLQYFGHVVRRDGVNLEKVVMFGKVEGKEVDVRGGQRLMWTDGICSITKLPVYSCYSKAQNHQRNFIRTVIECTQIWVERRRRRRLVPSGPMCVSARTDRLNKQTNDELIMDPRRRLNLSLICGSMINTR